MHWLASLKDDPKLFSLACEVLAFPDYSCSFVDIYTNNKDAFQDLANEIKKPKVAEQTLIESMENDWRKYTELNDVLEKPVATFQEFNLNEDYDVPSPTLYKAIMTLSAVSTQADEFKKVTCNNSMEVSFLKRYLPTNTIETHYQELSTFLKNPDILKNAKKNYENQLLEAKKRYQQANERCNQENVRKAFNTIKGLLNNRETSITMRLLNSGRKLFEYRSTSLTSDFFDFVQAALGSSTFLRNLPDANFYLQFEKFLPHFQEYQEILEEIQAMQASTS